MKGHAHVLHYRIQNRVPNTIKSVLNLNLSKMDNMQLKVTVLEDNNPMDEYNYLLSVNTGLRRGASTSSQVILVLGTDSTKYTWKSTAEFQEH